MLVTPPPDLGMFRIRSGVIFKTVVDRVVFPPEPEDHVFRFVDFLLHVHGVFHEILDALHTVEE